MDRDSDKKASQLETPDSDINNAANGQSQVTRRRALIAGLAAVPVVMSIMRTSAWGWGGGGGGQPNCSIVASYVNGVGGHFTSPQLPGHNVTIGWWDRKRCNL